MRRTYGRSAAALRQPRFFVSSAGPHAETTLRNYRKPHRAAALAREASVRHRTGRPGSATSHASRTGKASILRDRTACPLPSAVIACRAPSANGPLAYGTPNRPKAPQRPRMRSAQPSYTPRARETPRTNRPGFGLRNRPLTSEPAANGRRLRKPSGPLADMKRHPNRRPSQQAEDRHRLMYPVHPGNPRPAARIRLRSPCCTAYPNPALSPDAGRQNEKRPHLRAAVRLGSG